jgi:hypothetical protein
MKWQTISLYQGTFWKGAFHFYLNTCHHKESCISNELWERNPAIFKDS